MLDFNKIRKHGSQHPLQHFFNPAYFIIWLVILVFIFIEAKKSFFCWDGSELDEVVFVQKCGMLPKEYEEKFGVNFFTDSQHCPAGKEAERWAGGCGPNWPFVNWSLVVVSIVYNVIYAVIFLIRKKKKP